MHTDSINGKGFYQIDDDRCQETWLSKVITKLKIDMIIPNWYQVSWELISAWDMRKYLVIKFRNTLKLFIFPNKSVLVSLHPQSPICHDRR